MTATTRRDDTRDTSSPTAPDQRLVVEVTATVRLTQSFDIVEVFSQFTATQQDRYKNLDLAEWGFDFEWERPLAYLWPDAHDITPVDLAPGAFAPVRGDLDADIRLTHRGEERTVGRAGHWTEEDFTALAAQVPWLRQHHETLNCAVSEEDLARLPGPDDVPLF